MDREVEIFKALGEPTRLRLAGLLVVEGEVCVCSLAEALQLPDYQVSRHLTALRAAGLVTARRQGTWMYYSYRDPEGPFEMALCAALRVGVGAGEGLAAERKRLLLATCGVGAGARKRPRKDRSEGLPIADGGLARPGGMA